MNSKKKPPDIDPGAVYFKDALSYLKIHGELNYFFTFFFATFGLAVFAFLAGAAFFVTFFAFTVFVVFFMILKIKGYTKLFVYQAKINYVKPKAIIYLITSEKLY